MKTYPLLDLPNMLLRGLQEITALIDPLLVQSMNTSGKCLKKVSVYEACVIRSANWSLTLQQKGLSNCTIPNLIELYVPFHMGYGSLICSKKLQNDRHKCSA